MNSEKKEDRGVCHVIRYGIAAEQDYLVDFAPTYQLLAINGNMLAHAPNGLATFVSEKLITKAFFIDPQTHAFQHSPETLRSRKTNEIKTSLKKMIERYGKPLMGKEAALPKDFSDPLILSEFCDKVLGFQLSTIADASEENKKYLEYAEIDYKVRPEFLIAPYFFIASLRSRDWLEKNIEFLDVARRLKSDYDIWAQLVMSKDLLLKQSEMEEILKSYLTAKPTGILLWIDDFKEDEVTETLLERLVEIVSKFSAAGIRVYNLYGGYFSILLTKFSGLAGVAHGLEYGEDRSVIPVGGGLPLSKFYYPKLHKRLRYQDAASILRGKDVFGGSSAEYFSSICDCGTCRQVIGSDPNNFKLYGETKEVVFPRGAYVVTLNFPLPETRDRCIRHYLERKAMEFQMVGAAEKDSLLNELNETCEDEQFQRALGDQGVEHLRRWSNVLTNVR